MPPAIPFDHTLDWSLIRSISWTAAAKWSSQVLTWISTIIVARLLAPEDYGVIAMAGAFLGLLALVNEFGLGAAIVMLRNLSHEQITQINGLSIILGGAGFLVAVLAALPLSAFFAASELPWVVVAMGAGLIIASIRSVPCALLEKELRFKLLAVLEGGQAFVQAGVVVLLAYVGLKYWALVWAGLLSSVIASGIAIMVRPVKPAWPKLSALKSAMSLSWYIIGGRLSWYVASNADVFIAGRVLGQASLGAYTFGATLASMPMDKITALVNRVTPSFFSSIQNDSAALRRYLLNLTEALALVTIPSAVGLSLVADPFVRLVLGEQWEGAIAPLQVLAVYAAIRSVTSLLPPILMVTGGARLAMLNGLWAAIVFPCAFYVGSHWGTVGIALAWVIVHPCNLLPLYWRVFKTIGLTAGPYFNALRPALAAASVMAALVMAAKLFLPPGWPLFVTLALEVFIGTAAYVLAIIALHGRRLRLFVNLVRTGQSELIAT